MADYNWDQKRGVGGYMGEVRTPVFLTNDAHQDESGSKEGNDDQTGERFQDAPERSDNDFGGSKSADGDSREGTVAQDRRSGFAESQFGLEGKTGSYGHERSDPRSGDIDTSYRASNLNSRSRSNTESMADGDGWTPEDLVFAAPTHGAKDGLVSKIKEKMPGQHNTAGSEDGLMDKIKEKMPGHRTKGTGGMTDADDPPPKKGTVEKIKEKLPFHHGNDAGM